MIATRSKGERLVIGKAVEDFIFNKLVQAGYELTKPTFNQDCFDKIDAWFDGAGIQIKYRETGNDILFEVLRDEIANLPGRDMQGSAEFYAVMNREKTLIRIVAVSDCKNLIRHMMKEVAKVGWEDNQRKIYFSEGVAQLRRQPDYGTGTWKVMAYLPPTCVPILDLIQV